MKKCLLIVWFVLIHHPLMAAVSEHLEILSSESTACRITRQSATGLDIENTLKGLTLSGIHTARGAFVRPDIPGYVKGTGPNGAPDLPAIHLLIELPQAATVRIEVLDRADQTFALDAITGGLRLAPRQPGRSKGLSADAAAFSYNPEAYQREAVIAPDTLTVDILGTMRGVRMARVTLTPFRYHPKTNTLTVTGKLTVRLTFESADLERTETLKARYRSPAFDAAYTQLANPAPPLSRSKDALITASPATPLTYVVVASASFLGTDSLQAFIAWKRRVGFHVIEANTGTIFSSSSEATRRSDLKAWLEALYVDGDTPPTYVLFVGDVGQIPAWPGRDHVLDGLIYNDHVTDLYYCEYTGDTLPDAYYGRFPVETTAELNALVEKTLMYEGYTMPSPGYLDTVMLIAGADEDFSPTYANGQVAYLINEYFNVDSGFSDIYAFFYNQTWDWGHTVDTTMTGSTLVTTKITSVIDQGVGLVNYTGHCDVRGWFNDPASKYELDVDNLNELTNEDQYGFFVGNCCESSRFEKNAPDSFGEELVLAEQKGAVAYLGAANETFWDEDFYWAVGASTNALDVDTVRDLSYEDTGYGNFDALWHTHGESEDDWYTTAGQMVYVGNLAVMASSPDYGPYYWEVYNVLGDPSLSPWLGNPESMTEPTLAPIIPCTDTHLSLTAEPHTFVALSRNNELLDSAWSGASGDVSLNFDPLSSTDTVEIVMTRQNRQPLIMAVSLGAFPDSPPEAAFTTGLPTNPDIVHVVSGRPLRFINASTGCPESYGWTFEEGTPATSTEPAPAVVYTYTGPSLLSVTLTVANPYGENTLTRSAYIRVAPAIDFSADQTRVTTGSTVTFTDQSSHPASERYWTFQGGSPATSTEPAPTVRFDTVGAYTVSLTATIDGTAYPLSGPATKTSYIVVTEPSTDKNPDAPSSSSSDGGCFIDVSTDDVRFF